MIEDGSLQLSESCSLVLRPILYETTTKLCPYCVYFLFFACLWHDEGKRKYFDV